MRSGSASSSAPLAPGRNIQRDSGRVGSDASRLDDLLQERLKLDRRRVEAEPPRADPGEVEQVVHDGHETRAVAARQIDQILQPPRKMRDLA